MKSRHSLCMAIAVLTAALFFGSVSDVSAYTRWGSGCTDCHSNFRDSASTKPGNIWPDDKHDVHRRQMMTNLCGTCHISNGDDPFLDSSRGEPGLPGVSCMGCHGADPDPSVPNNNWWGAGLRQHHANADVGTDNGGDLCVDCHTDDPSPLGEDAVPLYYGGTNVNVFDPCNVDGSENWTSDGLGLDNDGDLDYDDADADCSPQNNAPTADAGPDQAVGVGDSVMLDGSGSSDPDGDPLSYSWSFDSVPTGSAATLSDPTAVMPTFEADEAGEYVVQLIVNDGQLDSDPDSVVISAAGANLPPVADAGTDQAVDVGETVQLDGSGSSDPDGDPVSYSWSFDSVPTGSTATLSDPTAVMPTFEADEAGEYVVQLIVNDGTVDSEPDTVTVNSVAVPPTVKINDAEWEASPATLKVRGLGPIGETVIITNAETGTHLGEAVSDERAKWKLDVFDLTLVPCSVRAALEDDPSAEAVEEVDDAPADCDGGVNLPPVADAGPDQTSDVGDTVMLDGSGSSDPNGDPLSYSWSFDSMPTGSTAALSDSTAVMPTFVADVAGEYVVQLIVNDGQLPSDPESVVISAVGGTVFKDGYESADTSAWSSAVP